MSKNAVNSRNGMTRSSSAKKLGLFTTNFADSWDRKSPIDRVSAKQDGLKGSSNTSRIQELIAKDVNSRLAKSQARRDRGGGGPRQNFSYKVSKSGGDLTAMRSSVNKGRRSNERKLSPTPRRSSNDGKLSPRPFSRKKASHVKSSNVSVFDRELGGFDRELGGFAKEVGGFAKEVGGFAKEVGGFEMNNHSGRQEVVRRKSGSDTTNTEHKSFISLSALRASLVRVAKPVELFSGFKSSNLPPDVLKYLEEDNDDVREVRRSKSSSDTSASTNKPGISLAALKSAAGRNGNASEPRENGRALRMHRRATISASRIHLTHWSTTDGEDTVM